MPEDRLDEYIREVGAARRRWEGKLRVFLGLEVDFIDGIMGPADREIQALGLDYVIGSVHYVTPPHGKPFAVDNPAEEFERDVREHYHGDGEAVMEAYWDAVEAMIRAGGFDILGHADLIKKNNADDRWFALQGERYRERLNRAAGLAAAAGVVVEVNTGGLVRGRYPELYPCRAFLEGRKLPVTITADAHRAEHLGGCYDIARDALLAAGYTSALLFEGQKDRRWSEDPL